MTEKKIPVERTVEETLLICDYCGSSSDDVEGDMVTFRDEMEEYEPLHIHEKCADEGLGDIGPRPHKESFWWKLYTEPVRSFARHQMEQDGREELTDDDMQFGWFAWIAVQALFIGFLITII